MKQEVIDNQLKMPYHTFDSNSLLFYMCIVIVSAWLMSVYRFGLVENCELNNPLLIWLYNLWSSSIFFICLYKIKHVYFSVAAVVSEGSGRNFNLQRDNIPAHSNFILDEDMT